jgi:transposase
MTLPLEVVTHIRRLHYAEHWKVGTIVAELKVHHDAVERALGLDTRGGMGVKRVLPTLLDAYKPFIREMLEKHPRLRATRLFHMVKPRGYQGSYEPVKLYVRAVRPRGGPEAFFRIETLPGEEAQVDWGLFGKLKVGDAQRQLCCFVMVLSHSRAVYARFALDMTMESFLRGHVGAFAALGGVPRRVLYDNLKSVVLERYGDAVRFHPRLLELAGHYHYAPTPCAPYRGNEKGKVERTIRYLRDSFFAARRFTSLADLNAQLSTWVSEVAMARQWPGAKDNRRVVEVFGEEKPRLMPLPAGAFSTDVIRAVSSGKTPYVRFDGNDYSLPHTLVRKPLTLCASEDTVRLLDGSDEVARHARSYDNGRRFESEGHLAGLAKQKRRAAQIRSRDVLKASLKHAADFFAALCLRDKSLSHEAARLTKLVSKYGAADVDAAMAAALARHSASAASVAHLLDVQARNRGQLPPLEVVVPESVRHVHVTPHALSDYDGLVKKQPEGEGNTEGGAS